MMARDEVVLKQIMEYVKDDRYKQAIMINGEWGTGKTFFIKNKLKACLERELPDKKTYYISLYGISDIQQIYNEICTVMLEEKIEHSKMLEMLKQKVGDEVIEKGSNYVRKGANIMAKLIGTGAGYFNIDTSKLPDISDFKDIGDAVIIFDDLERCEIEINQVLGTINNLVEHNNVKIILVACEKEIGKKKDTKELSNKFLVALNERINWQSSNDNREQQEKCTIEQLKERTDILFPGDEYYKKVKEKLIGLTIVYEANISDIFESLIEEQVKVDSVKQFLKENKDSVVSIFLENNHSNIRTLLFGLIAFERIFEVLEKIEYDAQYYIEHQKITILKYVFECAIRIKSNMYNYPWGNRTVKYGTVYWGGNFFGDKSDYGYKFVDDYLLDYNLDETEIEEIIVQIATEKKEYDADREKQASLRINQLREWWNYEDEEVFDMLDTLRTELKEQKYGPRYFKEIVIALMQMKERGFQEIDYDDYISEMESYLKDNIKTTNQKHLKLISTDPTFVQDYNIIVKPLTDIIEKEEHDRKEIDISFLSDKNFWNDDFSEKCNALRDVFMFDRKFFYYIKPDSIMDSLNSAKVKEINNFSDGIRTIYDFSNLNDFFKADIENLEIIISKIDVENEQKITRKVALNRLKNVLQESLISIKK